MRPISLTGVFAVLVFVSGLIGWREPESRLWSYLGLRWFSALCFGLGFLPLKPHTMLVLFDIPFVVTALFITALNLALLPGAGVNDGPNGLAYLYVLPVAGFFPVSALYYGGVAGYALLQRLR